MWVTAFYRFHHCVYVFIIKCSMFHESNKSHIFKYGWKAPFLIGYMVSNWIIQGTIITVDDWINICVVCICVQIRPADEQILCHIYLHLLYIPVFRLRIIHTMGGKLYMNECYFHNFLVSEISYYRFWIAAQCSKAYHYYIVIKKKQLLM